MKKLVKLAVIRDDRDEPCPFGLPIAFACSNVGEFIKKMAPLDAMGPDSTSREKQKIAEANQNLMSWAVMMSKEPPKECFYAGKLFPGHKDKVECNFGDTAAGNPEKGVPLGSPFYSKVFAGIGLDGMYAVPTGIFADMNISRNSYYGQYSIQGSINNKNLIRKAIEIIHERMNIRP